MLKLTDGALVLAATDLTNFLACDHLTQQRLGIALGQRARPRPVDDPHSELIRTRGERHEREQLERLAAGCGGFVDLSSDRAPTTREALEAGARATLEAMRAGAPLIFQAQFFDGRWQGRTDFLRRIDVPSALDGYAYEVLDTKLAREVKPHVVHQLSLYNRLLADVQGVDVGVAHLVLGDGSEVRIELNRYAALHRHVIRHFERVVDDPPTETYPEPVAHCPICAFHDECYMRRVTDDHLSLVANARRDQRERLVKAGIQTVGQLATASDDAPVGGLGAERFSLLHHQAALQVDSRDSGQPRHRHLAPAKAAGYAALPAASRHDIFFDLEGDPYIGDGGIEYLWGWWTAGGGYECLWAHDVAAEKAAFEQFVDRVVALRQIDPDLHVYHYAPHERAKLRSLSVQYATREDEVDDLLRDGVLVDLYAVVRHALQVGEESYSLKKLERHHGFERLERSIREGGGSIVAYEAWLETGEAEILEAIRDYNAEDCISTRSLRDWLVDAMRPEAEVQLGVNFDEWREAETEDRDPPAWMPDVLDLVRRLADGLPDDPRDDTVDEAERRLVSHLLLYHHRESKPSWWRYFDLRGRPIYELIDDRDALADLRLDTDVAPTPYKRSLDYTFRFPAQEFRLHLGKVEDPTSRAKFNLVGVADDHVVLRRGVNSGPPAPVALIDGSPVGIAVLREAIVALAQSFLAGDGSFPAVRALLRREPPRLASGTLGEEVQELNAAVLGLDRSILPIQGPPGTGKTYRAARMIVACLAAGRRVGVTAQSHAVIQNVLREVEGHADATGVSFHGVYKGKDEGDQYESAHELIEVADDNEHVEGDFGLVAGTAWLFARPEHRQSLDVLFVDEAGQFSLANAAAVGLAASNLVFLGDPQQLPQVTQVQHPGGSGASILEHLLEGNRTVQPGRGVLLTESWRMHPDVCRFVSERSYDGRLRSRDACGNRRVDAVSGRLRGTGLRAVGVEHAGRSQSSPEEAAAIAVMCEELLDEASVTDDEAGTRPLTAGDILVVAPYNLAVRCIRDRVPAGVRVGTVDKFQGQEAPVVFYAMTCSAGEDVPRGIDFLFDDHRLNVAVSRAQCLAVLVHSARLLDADCRTLEAMTLVDGVCRFVEMATQV